MLLHTCTIPVVVEGRPISTFSPYLAKHLTINMNTHAQFTDYASSQDHIYLRCMELLNLSAILCTSSYSLSSVYCSTAGAKFGATLTSYFLNNKDIHMVEINHRYVNFCMQQNMLMKSNGSVKLAQGSGI